MSAATRLSVNVDHVATLRQARQTPYPDPVDAARRAEAAGAAGITAHLRADRRHIQDDDVARLMEVVVGRLNLEISTAPESVGVAVVHQPHQVTLVPERPEELTTEGGLDLRRQGSRVGAVALKLAGAGIAVSLFVDPEERTIEQVASLRDDLGEGIIGGFELNTDAYTRAEGEAVEVELTKVRRAAARGSELGLAAYAGHGLTTANVAPIAAIPAIEELNIGHALISDAVLEGIEAAVRAMLEAMARE